MKVRMNSWKRPLFSGAIVAGAGADTGTGHGAEASGPRMGHIIASHP